ncbi:BTAD domain-containing putative transcriptional regulator [Amycolatopsis minnesotensis]|uniref:OmpR/PhoB-type domain-containing protein n=1 Tax=Amycolatopsis minnesotensis TaxID=337894 RepID=A0ABN2REH9_9PSEU
MRFEVLGPLVAGDGNGTADLKGPRHRAVLARLLVARGRVVPVGLLVDDLWENPPDGALGAVQTFVSALRRALEPGRAPRTPARLLVTAAPGYALRAEPGAVDAWRFEALVTAAGTSLEERRAGDALSEVDQALALWRGPAYAEFADQAWARAEIDRLDELRLLAAERRAEALLALGRAAEAVPELEARTGTHPWREDGWRLLALALYRAGRQGDALGALRRARHVLAEELGVDPGPALRRVEADILAHEPALTAPAAEVRGPRLVGRAGETAQLDEAAATVAERGKPGLVLVSGDAGAGKTALTEAFTARLAAQGWTTAWGSNPEDEGLPAAWPWSRVLAALGAEDTLVPTTGSAEDPVTARFHRHRAVGAHLASVARKSPLLLVLDDLHWAGEETLALLASVVAEPIGPVLVITTYRTTDLTSPLASFLGRAARAEPARVYLGGLSAAAVSELVRATSGLDPDEATVETIRRRSGGNPFFVRELARLLGSDGALASVPPGVRDVVRYRVAKLPDPVEAVLRVASVIGTEIDLGLLAEVTGGEVLDAVETATERGFLTERGPRRFRFAHALVRETLYHDISRSRRARWHEEIGGAIERMRPDDADSLAHHFLAAESPKAVRYARAAAERAELRFAPHEAARLWLTALTAHDRDGDRDVRARLDLIMGRVRALAVTGELAEARRHRADAVAIADGLGDPALTARVLGAFDVPAIWTEHDDRDLAARIAEVTERTLASLPPGPTAERGRLLATLALELRNTGGDRAREAAREAERIARELGELTLLAFALNAAFMQSFDRSGLAPRRVRIGEELVDLATRHSLVGFAVLGHLVLVQAHSALAEFAAADRHAEAAGALGVDHEIPLVSVFTDWYAALRAAVTGRAAEAESAYRAVGARTARTGMSGMDRGILPFALLCHRLQQGLTPEDGDFGAYESWCGPVLRPAAGAEIPVSPDDLLREARDCLHATVAIGLGDGPAMTGLYARLLPAADELAGAGSGILTLRPVAHYLGDLASALGRREDAAGHYRQALAVADRAGAPHWAEAARAALSEH